MYIVFLSTADSNGAGMSAYSIYNTLKKQHECKFIVFRKDTSLNDVYEVNDVKQTSFFLSGLPGRIIAKFFVKRPVIDPNYCMLNLNDMMPYLKTKKLESMIGKKPDLIILNWISGFINSHDIKTLYEKYKVPFIWILHDSAPLTGGCHIVWNCRGFTGTCGNCPGMHSTDKNDKTHKILKRKIKNFLNVPIFTTGWSDFSLNRSRQSTLFKSRTLIPLAPAIDSKRFSPSEDKTLSKKNLSIPAQSKVVLFGAQDIFIECKGFKHLIAALNILRESLHPGIDFILVTFGQATEELSTPINFPWISLGVTDNPGLAYQASDVFVAPTLQDNLPTTVCESLMCGVPVVGYPMGIIPDVIRNDETGYIVEEGAIKSLANNIAAILNLSENAYQVISQNCRSLALEKLSEKAQLQSFQDLFDLIKLNQTI
jgi:glycosyltransferase involved in cell wall biosynthesis